MTRLCRSIDGGEAHDTVCWSHECAGKPSFRISTPYGLWDACDGHVDELIAELPQSWIDGYRRDASELVPDDVDQALEEIPF